MIDNPFLKDYNTPYGTTPFEEINISHYVPAIKEGIRVHDEEINQIAHNAAEPTFENTIVALERSGNVLDRVTTVMGNLLSADTCDELQQIAEEMTPLLSEHSNNITLNDALFKRIKVLYDQKEQLDLSIEQEMLLNKTYIAFVNKGANLDSDKKEIYRRITAELSQLKLQFSQNKIKETGAFKLWIEKEADILDMPDSIVSAAKAKAKEQGVDDKWLFTLHAPSYVPFMKYCSNRELRKTMYMASNTICLQNNEFNNLEIVRQIINDKLAVANLLGYDNYASFVLKQRMAKDCQTVYSFLENLHQSYISKAKQEVQTLCDYAKQISGESMELMPWDFAYYAEKLRQEKYAIDEEQLKPYFELNNVIDGVFELATRLYDISFKENKEIPVYHPDVKAYEVFDKDGSFLAVLYADFYSRESKQSGAWMTSYKEQWIEGCENSRPHISITTNFTSPTGNLPVLLTLNEVNTFLHEFGHALHGMFANSTYASLSGTNVYWDFVELPSQLMENFLYEREFLEIFARHYQTGEIIPADYIQKIQDAANYNVAYACIRQLSFGYLDMDWYTLTKPFTGDVLSFEAESFSKCQLLPAIPGTNMTVQFGHIMSGGYAAGYYSYKWAEVLDADAFSLFKEKGIFNKEVSYSFRENILSKGGTQHPMDLYKSFRGKEPSVDALLKRNGINNLSNQLA